MQPTMKLRYLRKLGGSTELGQTEHGDAVYGYFLLQQWWAIHRHGQETPTGEWRDIEICNEES